MTIVDVQCTGCGKRVWAVISERYSVDGFECCGCGMKFLAPELTLDELGEESIEDCEIIETYETPNAAAGLGC